MPNARPLCACLVAASVAACAAPPPPGSEACIPRPLAQLPVGYAGGAPVVPVRIDGQLVSMVLDLGAEFSLVSETAADRLHLPRDPSALPIITGIGGTMMRWAAKARQLQLGDLTVNDKRMEVAPMTFGAAEQPVAGLIGLDILTKYDIDWDLPDRQVTLNAKSGCEGPPPGWPSPAAPVSLGHPVMPENTVAGAKFILLQVRVDGRPITAMLDTGAGISLISPATAAVLEAPNPGEDKNVQLRGVGPGGLSGTAHRFRSLTIAGSTVPRWPMVVGPVPQWAGSMILGADFLRTHRAWLPAGGSRIWFGPGVARQPAAQPAPGLSARNTP
jgi:hypothetical protein